MKFTLFRVSGCSSTAAAVPAIRLSSVTPGPKKMISPAEIYSHIVGLPASSVLMGWLVGLVTDTGSGRLCMHMAQYCK
jgi:hypothetical protein